MLKTKPVTKLRKRTVYEYRFLTGAQLLTPVTILAYNRTAATNEMANFYHTWIFIGRFPNTWGKLV